MSRPLAPTKVLTFFGLLIREDLISFENVYELICDKAPLNSDFSFELKDAGLKSYYQNEMGPAEKLKRAWVFGGDTISREELVPLKLWANSLEEELKQKHGAPGRILNIDPGYIALEQVLLSTCKPYGHRVYLSDMVYAELTYQFQGGEFHELPWTYPDYREDLVKKQFARSRDFLKGLLS